MAALVRLRGPTGLGVAASVLLHAAAALAVLRAGGGAPHDAPPAVAAMLSIGGLAAEAEAGPAGEPTDFAEPAGSSAPDSLDEAAAPVPVAADPPDQVPADAPPPTQLAAAVPPPPSLPSAAPPSRAAVPHPVRPAAAPRPAPSHAAAAPASPLGARAVPAAGAGHGIGAAAVEEGPLLIATPRFRLPPAAPTYPMRARDLGQEGEVVVRARLDRSGTPEEVTVHRSSGFDLLDRAALAAVRRWAFEPGRRGGAPVVAWVQVPVRFALR